MEFLSNKIIKTLLLKDFNVVEMSKVRFGPDNFMSFWIILKSQKIGLFRDGIYIASLRLHSSNRQFNRNRNIEYLIFFNFISNSIKGLDELVLCNKLRYF